MTIRETCSPQHLQFKKLLDGAQNILLIKPPIEEIIPSIPKYSGKFFSFASQPSALLRLGSYLKSLGKNVSLIDCSAETQGRPNSISNRTFVGYRTAGDGKTIQKAFRYGMDGENLNNELNMNPKPDLILVSCSITYHRMPAHDVIAACKKKYPDVPVVFGGIYPTLCPDEAAKSGADMVYVGEFPEVNFFESDLGLLDYIPSYSVIKSTRGCPNRCSYCAVSLLEGNTMHFRAIEETIKEIADTKKKYGISHFIFWESNFLVDSKKHFEILLDKLIDLRLGIYLSAPEGLSPNLLTINLTKKMKKAGFIKINIPLESSDKKMQARFSRTSTLEDFRRSVGNLIEAGFKAEDIRVFVLIGLPYQSRKGILDSLITVWELGCSPTIMPFTPIPNTREYDNYRSLIAGKKLEDLHPFSWPFAGTVMPSSELENIYLYHKIIDPIEYISRKKKLTKLDKVLVRRIKVNRKIWDLYHERNLLASQDMESPDLTVIMAEKKFLSSGRSKMILDLGCGKGKNSLYLRNKGHQVYGLDRSHYLIKNLMDGLDSDKFQAADSIKINSMQKYDVVIDINNINSTDKVHIERYFDRISSILVEKGIYVIRSFSEYGHLAARFNAEAQEIKSPFLSYFSEKELRNLLKSRFEILEFNKLHYCSVKISSRYCLVPGMFELFLRKM